MEVIIISKYHQIIHIFGGMMTVFFFEMCLDLQQKRVHFFWDIRLYINSMVLRTINFKNLMDSLPGHCLVWGEISKAIITRLPWQDKQDTFFRLTDDLLFPLTLNMVVLYLFMMSKRGNGWSILALNSIWEFGYNV